MTKGFVRFELTGGFLNIVRDPRIIPPRGKFRVVGIDNLSGSGWIEDDFPSLDVAQSHAASIGDMMYQVHIFDHDGTHQGQVGIF